MSIASQITSVCFVGAGTMGCYNALAAAISGYRVAVFDVSAENLGAVPQRQQDMAAMLVGAGYCTQDDLPAALERIHLFGDLADAVAGCQLISESVFERLDIKRQVHRQLEQLCDPQVVITTNTSNLTVSDIEQALDSGRRFAALHTHFGSPLVDVVPGPRTEDGVTALLQRYVESTGGVPLLLKKEYPGYVLNALLGPLLRAAIGLKLESNATLEQIDGAWMAACQAPMGPFGMMDLFGLDLIGDSWNNPGDQRKEQLRPAVLALLQPMLDAGRLGIKTGAGFYNYPDPAYQQEGFCSRHAAPAAVLDTLLCDWIMNAILIVAADVAAQETVDRAWQVGTFLPRGPFAALAGMGVAVFADLLAREMRAGRLDEDKVRQAQQWLQASADNDNN